MEYTGTRLKLQPGDVTAAAASIDVPEASLRSVMDVETSGHGYDAAGHLEILFERHLFYRHLENQPDKLQQAEAAGLAYPKWGTRPYPKTPSLRWAELMRAVQIDETAALSSTSFGLGQILGQEYAECNYRSPQDLVTQFFVSEKEQVEAMCRLIKARHLDVDMRNFPASSATNHFALRYNGAGYKKNHYDTKLAANYTKWKKRLEDSAQETAAASDDSGTLKPGMHGPRVKLLQQKLDDRNYHVNADGDFGNLTRDAVVAWKMDQGLPPKPEVTPEQFAQLDASSDRPLADSRKDATVADLKGQSKIVDLSSTLKKGSAAAGTAVAVADAAGGDGNVDKVAEAAKHAAESVPADAPVSLDPGALLDHAQNVLDKGQQAKGLVQQAQQIVGDSGLHHVLGFMHDHIAIIAIVAFVAIFFGGSLIQKARLQMHANGEAQ